MPSDVHAVPKIKEGNPQPRIVKLSEKFWGPWWGIGHKEGPSFAMLSSHGP